MAEIVENTIEKESKPISLSETTDISALLKQRIIDAIRKTFLEYVLNYKFSYKDIVIEKSKDSSHGDYATNVAMKFSKPFLQKPLVISPTD